MNHPTTSIAMCTYNGARFLQKQLDSFAAQTVLPGELVACDDGSTDNTLEILETFAQTAPFPVRIYRNESNLGYIKNFEKAGLLCENEVVFFSDQDDIWLPQKIERVAEVFGREPDVGLVLLSASLIDEDDRVFQEFWMDTSATLCRELEAFTPERLKRHRFQIWPGCNMVYRNTFRDVIYPISSIHSHDDWIFHLLNILSEVRIFKTPFDLHRFHRTNTSRSPKTLGHLRKTRNLRTTMRRYYTRHLNPARLLFQMQQFSRVVEHSRPLVQTEKSREVFAYYQRIEQHFFRRAEAISHPLRRPWIVFSEILNGNYWLWDHSLQRIFTDLLAIPLPPNREDFPSLADFPEKKDK